MRFKNMDTLSRSESRQISNTGTQLSEAYLHSCVSAAEVATNPQEEMQCSIFKMDFLKLQPTALLCKQLQICCASVMWSQLPLSSVTSLKGYI